MELTDFLSPKTWQPFQTKGACNRTKNPGIAQARLYLNIFHVCPFFFLGEKDVRSLNTVVHK